MRTIFFLKILHYAQIRGVIVQHVDYFSYKSHVFGKNENGLL